MEDKEYNTDEEEIIIRNEDTITDLTPFSRDIEYANVENSLLRGFYKLSLMGQRMLIQDLTIRKQRVEKHQLDLNNKYYFGSKFSVKSFLNDWNTLDGGKQRSLVIKAGNELASMKLGIENDKTGEIVFLNLYQAVKINPEASVITTYYTDAFADYLNSTGTLGYTRLIMEKASKLKDDKAFHWYTYLSTYRHLQGKGGNDINHFFQILTFDEIRKIFMIKGYDNSASFRLRVIENPLQRINDSDTDLHVTWEYLKDRTGSAKKYTAVKIKVEITDNWDFKDIGFVLKILGRDISEQSRNIIIDNKERYLDLVKLMSKYQAQNIDFNDLSTPENLAAIKLFFLKVAGQLDMDLKNDDEFKKNFRPF